MLRKTVHLFFILTALVLTSSFTLAEKSSQPFDYFIVHKCGTHLLIKLFHLIKTQDPQFNFYKHSRVHPSCLESGEIERLLFFARCYVMVRDPRDQLLSYLFYLDRQCQKQDNPNFQREKKEIWCALTFEEKLNALIENKRSLIPFAHHLVERDWVYAAKWSTLPGVCLVKYEHLIGEKGGGSEKQQRAEIKKILTHIDYAYSEELIDFLVYHLWGQQSIEHDAWLTKTFRKGCCHEWKRYFGVDALKRFSAQPFWTEMMQRFDYQMIKS